jgi:hypothetical protein
MKKYLLFILIPLFLSCKDDHSDCNRYEYLDETSGDYQIFDKKEGVMIGSIITKNNRSVISLDLINKQVVRDTLIYVDLTK